MRECLVELAVGLATVINTVVATVLITLIDQRLQLQNGVAFAIAKRNRDVRQRLFVSFR